MYEYILYQKRCTQNIIPNISTSLVVSICLASLFSPI